MQDSDFDRLVNCFQNVFPNLSASDIPDATHANVAEWDSIAQITLLSLVGEAFSREIDFEEFEDATSFQAILKLLQANAATA